MAKKLQQEEANTASNMTPQAQSLYPPSPFITLSKRHAHSPFENPCATPDEIDYFTERRNFRLKHAMEEDGCGMMSCSAPPTMLTKITGEVWKELRPTLDTKTGSLVLDSQSQTTVGLREAQEVYDRDR